MSKREKKEAKKHYFKKDCFYFFAFFSFRNMFYVNFTHTSNAARFLCYSVLEVTKGFLENIFQLLKVKLRKTKKNRNRNIYNLTIFPLSIFLNLGVSKSLHNI